MKYIDSFFYRLMNIFSYAGFIGACFGFFGLFIILASQVSENSISRILEKPYYPSDYHSISQSDIKSSLTLRNLGAKSGDLIDQKTKKLVSIPKIYSFFYNYGSNEEIFGISFLSFCFYLFSIIINYLLIGRFRFLPWRNGS